MVGRGGEIILPGSFLPVAEQYGLIAEIDRWVVGQAIRLAARGQRFEVNLSAATIGHLDLLPLIERTNCARRTRIPRTSFSRSPRQR